MIGKKSMIYVHWKLQFQQAETIELGQEKNKAMLSQAISIKPTNAPKLLFELFFGHFILDHTMDLLTN
jgi:hypothetical protein